MSIFIALGTNIEPRNTYLTEALASFEGHEHITVLQKSSIYETAPVGYANQADFLNMVIEVGTTLSPLDLLGFCQSAEHTLGRKRLIRNGPRTIDLDILTYHMEIKETDRLIIPHPRMQERAFVLVPLAEIAPSCTIPGTGKSASELLHALAPADKLGVIPWKHKDAADV